MAAGRATILRLACAGLGEPLKTWVLTRGWAGRRIDKMVATGILVADLGFSNLIASCSVLGFLRNALRKVLDKQFEPV